MNDKSKTKQELISELAEMRQRIAELEGRETERKKENKEIKRTRDDYLMITNLTGDIIVRADTEGKLTFLWRTKV